MDLTDTIEKDETAEKINSLISKAKVKLTNENERGKAIKIIEEATDLYIGWVQEKGLRYIKRDYPEISKEISELINKLTEYNS